MLETDPLTGAGSRRVTCISCRREYSVPAGALSNSIHSVDHLCPDCRGIAL